MIPRCAGARVAAPGCPIVISGKILLEILGVHRESDANLVLIIDALGAKRFGFGAGQRGQKHRGQNGNNGYHDEQLDQSEGALGTARIIEVRRSWRCKTARDRAGMITVWGPGHDSGWFVSDELTFACLGRKRNTEISFSSFRGVYWSPLAGTTVHTDLPLPFRRGDG